MKRNSASALLASAFFLLTASSAQAQVVYSLAGDWSEVANPNGVWAYNAAPGMPLTNHVSDYFAGQPAWAYTVYGGPGHIPWFLKAVTNYGSPSDLPMGRVGMHN